MSTLNVSTLPKDIYTVLGGYLSEADLKRMAPVGNNLGRYVIEQRQRKLAEEFGVNEQLTSDQYQALQIIHDGFARNVITPRMVDSLTGFTESVRIHLLRIFLERVTDESLVKTESIYFNGKFRLFYTTQSALVSQLFVSTIPLPVDLQKILHLLSTLATSQLSIYEVARGVSQPWEEVRRSGYVVNRGRHPQLMLKLKVINEELSRINDGVRGIIVLPGYQGELQRLLDYLQLPDSHLSYFCLSGIGLQVYPAAFERLNAAYIDLSHNQLEQFQLKDWDGLNGLDLSYNKLRKPPVEDKPISDRSFLGRVQEINLSHNQLTAFPDILLLARRLVSLNVSYNDLEDREDFVDPTAASKEFSEHERDIAYSDISLRMTHCKLKRLPSILSLTFNGKGTWWPYSLSIRSLDASYNELTEIDILLPSKEGYSFNFSYNRLGSKALNNPNQRSFKISILNLSHNRIESLTVRSNSSVSELNLSYNPLKKLTVNRANIDQLSLEHTFV